MNLKVYPLLFCLLFTHTLLPMKSLFRSMQLTKIPYLPSIRPNFGSFRYFYQAVALAAKTETVAQNNHSSLICKRTFSATQPNFDLWDSAKWFFKSKEQKKIELFEALQQTIQLKKSKYLPDASNYQVIRKIIR
jgi:hypothetical protein